MLSENEFKLLNGLRVRPGAVQRELAQSCNLSLGTVNSTYKVLVERKFIADGRLTAEGMSALLPYKVDNAVILAAGVSRRFVPISYEKPKGTLRVRGEVLIERIIEQLHEAGINDITMVVGYMKEQFFYLEDLYGVRLIVNNEYIERNNNVSVKLASDRLANTYIVTSDNYFVENVFEPYVYKAYYASVFSQDDTDEWALVTSSGNRITKVQKRGGREVWVMMGQAYFDRRFSTEFKRILNEVYDHPETAHKLWEEIYSDHIRDLDMDIRKYRAGIIFEFDSLEDVRGFDPEFVTNIDSVILDNIVNTLGCTRGSIEGVVAVEGGLSNFSFYFRVGTSEYVYRHPGMATKGLIDRAVEARVESIARELGLDNTFLYQDPHIGWKISKYVNITEPFDYHNIEHVRAAMGMIKKLHNAKVGVDSTFDLFAETKKVKALLEGSRYLDFPDYDDLDSRIAELYGYVSQDKDGICLCHNDFYSPNLLISDGELSLIDWEYAGMNNYASDLGTFVCCSSYGYDEAITALETYYGRQLSPDELCLCMSYVAISGYYWFIWALNKEANNEPVGDWLHLWYRCAKEFGDIAEKLVQGRT